MPFKHQMNCYRTFSGVKWPNFCDILTDAMRVEVAAMQKRGVRLRIRKHRDGYFQAFIHPDDLAVIRPE